MDIYIHKNRKNKHLKFGYKEGDLVGGLWWFEGLLATVAARWFREITLIDPLADR